MNDVLRRPRPDVNRRRRRGVEGPDETVMRRHARRRALRRVRAWNAVQLVAADAVDRLREHAAHKGRRVLLHRVRDARHGHRETVTGRVSATGGHAQINVPRERVPPTAGMRVDARHVADPVREPLQECSRDGARPARIVLHPIDRHGIVVHLHRRDVLDLHGDDAVVDGRRGRRGHHVRRLRRDVDAAHRVAAPVATQEAPAVREGVNVGRYTGPWILAVRDALHEARNVDFAEAVSVDAATAAAIAAVERQADGHVRGADRREGVRARKVDAVARACRVALDAAHVAAVKDAA